MFATRTWITLLVSAVLVAVALSNARVSNGAGHETRHRVHAGETLCTIAEANYGGDPRAGVWKLERRNHLENDLLRPGQRLYVPP